MFYSFIYHSLILKHFGIFFHRFPDWYIAYRNSKNGKKKSDLVDKATSRVIAILQKNPRTTRKEFLQAHPMFSIDRSMRSTDIILWHTWNSLVRQLYTFQIPSIKLDFKISFVRVQNFKCVFLKSLFFPKFPSWFSLLGYEPIYENGIAYVFSKK